MYISAHENQCINEGYNLTISITNSEVTILSNLEQFKFLEPPTVSRIPGNLAVGKYVYAYRLVKKNGIVTIPSAISASNETSKKYGHQYIGSPVLTDIKNADDSLDYQKLVKSKSGFRVIAPDQDSTFDYIEFIRLYWYSAEQEPVIEIFGIIEVEKPVPSMPYVIQDTDNAKVLKSLSLAEFITPPSEFTAGFAEMFNNRIFKANLLEEYEEQENLWQFAQFPNSDDDIEFAVPQGGSGGASIVYTTNRNIFPTLVPGVGDNKTYNDNYNSISEYVANTRTVAPGIQTDNAIHNYDGDYGAQGPNVKITVYPAYNIKEGLTKHGVTPSSGDKIWHDVYGKIANTSLTEQELEDADIVRGLQVDSIYRLSVTFYKANGKSDTFYMGDLRTPAYNPELWYSFEDLYDHNHYLLKTLQLKVELSNIPDKYIATHINYVKREKSDRPVLGYGVAVKAQKVQYTAGTRRSMVSCAYPGNHNLQYKIATTDVAVLYNPEHLIGNVTFEESIKQKPLQLLVNSIGGWTNQISNIYTHHYHRHTDGGSGYPSSFSDVYGSNFYTKCKLFEIPFTKYSSPHVIEVSDNGGTYDVGSGEVGFDSTSDSFSLNLEGSYYQDTKTFPYTSKALATVVKNPIPGDLVELGESWLRCDYEGEPEYVYTIPVRKALISLIQSTRPYRGGSKPSREGETYTKFSDVKEVQSDNTCTIDGVYGDTYTGFFYFQQAQRSAIAEDIETPFTPEIPSTMSRYAFAVMQSSVNIHRVASELRDMVQSKDATLLGIKPEDNTQHVHQFSDYAEIIELNKSNIYTYDTLNNLLPGVTPFKELARIVDTSVKFPNMIRWTDRKFAGEFYDNFTRFKPNNFNELNQELGYITNLISFRDRLILFQERGLSMLHINQVSQVIDLTEEQVALGAGDILGQGGGSPCTVISKNVGCTYGATVLRSKSALYWIDNNSKHLYRWDGTRNPPQALSLIAGIPDVFDCLSKDSKLSGIYKSDSAEVYLSIINSVQDAAANFNDALYEVLDYEPSTRPPYITIEGDIDNLDIKIGDKVYLDPEYPELYVMLNDIVGNELHFDILQDTESTIVAGDVLDLSWHKSKLKNFTIVYNEVLQSFTHVLNFAPYKWISADDKVFTIPSYDADTPYYVGSTLYEMFKQSSQLWDNLVPSKISLMFTAEQYKQWDIISWITEFYSEHPDINRTSDIMKTLTHIRVHSLYHRSAMHKIRPMLDYYNMTEEQDADFETAQLQVIPEGLESEIDVNANSYNAEKKNNSWLMPMPRIRSITEAPHLVEDLDSNSLNKYEPIKSNWIKVELYFVPINNINKIKLCSVNC